jgi:DNA-binding CsgD family transcriptional regulator
MIPALISSLRVRLGSPACGAECRGVKPASPAKRLRATVVDKRTGIRERPVTGGHFGTVEDRCWPGGDYLRPSMCVGAMQPAELIEAVREAIAKDATRRARRCEQAKISARLAQLTARERQVLRLISTGMLNKQIAAELGSAEKTIKVHRGRILDKMRVRTATALVALLSRMEPPEAEAPSAVSTRAQSASVVITDARGPATAHSPDISRAAPPPSCCA